MEVKKSKKAAIESRRGTWLLMGFVATLALMFVTFEWTQRDVKVASGLLAGNDPIFEESLIPITFREEKLPPPPLPEAKVPEALIIVENDAKVTEALIGSTEEDGKAYEIGWRPAAVEKEIVVEDEIFVFAENMPVFPGGDAALMQYLGKNIKYPIVPQETGIQGRVIVQFVVDKDGTITHPVILKSVDPYLDKEALRVINAMPKWTPGKQRNQPVRVKYTLPVVFRLQ
ncbi:energy transducer TonB [Bacteroides sp.]|uniref:energy transducer TonB n=1 Tax=Bacteroides sp. TaxID=29523 RepID=UPI002FCB43FD